MEKPGEDRPGTESIDSSSSAPIDRQHDSHTGPSYEDGDTQKSNTSSTHKTDFVATLQSQNTQSKQFMSDSKENEDEEVTLRKAPISLQSQPNTEDYCVVTTTTGNSDDKKKLNSEQCEKQDNKGPSSGSGSASSGPSFVVLPNRSPDDPSSSISLWSMMHDTGHASLPSSASSLLSSSNVYSEASLLSQVK